MFKVRGEDEAEFLEEDRDETFNHPVAQLLFIISGSRMDIQTVV